MQSINSIRRKYGVGNTLEHFGICRTLCANLPYEVGNADDVAYVRRRVRPAEKGCI